MIDTVVTRFGLARMPFGRDLPPSRLHRHRDCGEAAARITWAVADKTICMVTGEVGTGKTVAIRSAVADLDPSGHTIIYIGNPATGVRGILAHVVTALGGRPVHGTAALAVQAWNVLAGEAAERGRTPVLVIDEAHLLSYEQLETVRMLTNHPGTMDADSPLACLLIGQPTLRRTMKLAVLAALVISSPRLGVFAVAAAGVLCAFCCVVDTLPEQCLRRGPRANPLVAAVSRI